MFGTDDCAGQILTVYPSIETVQILGIPNTSLLAGGREDNVSVQG